MSQCAVCSFFVAVRSKLDFDSAKFDKLLFIPVNSTPAGAEIFVYGKPTGQVTPAQVQMEAGSHIISLQLNGFLIAKRGVQTSEGGTVNVTETLKPE